MIKGNLETMDFYAGLFPKCKAAFDFIRKARADMENKRYEIADGIYALSFNSVPKAPQDRKPETHDKYIDIQYVADDSYDIIGFKNKSECGEIDTPYNAEKDITFYKTQEVDSCVKIKKGEFVMIFPDEAHAPESGDRECKKFVVKVRLDLLKS
jgi:YhcH/YjgK/YiaL family protein